MMVNLHNSGTGQQVSHNPYLRLGAGAKVIQSKLVDNVTVDTASCINKCDIGRYFGLGCFSYVANSKIGRYCTFGARVSVGAFSHPTDWLSIHEFQYRNTLDIYGASVLEVSEPTAPANPVTHIGSDVWIGDNVCVRSGKAIGHGAILGLGAVVVADVPPYAIMGGNPARILRYRFEPEIVHTLLGLAWWELDMQHLKGLDFSDIHQAIDAVRRINENLAVRP